MSNEDRANEQAVAIVHHSNMGATCNRRFTVAGVLRDGKLRLGIAVVNPEDWKWNRKLGTVKALGRARSQHPLLEVAFSYDDGETTGDQKALAKAVKRVVGDMAARLASNEEADFMRKANRNIAHRPKPVNQKPRLSMTT